LPWLSPWAASLRALARAGEAWSEVRRDPGCVLLLLRQSAAPGAASGLSFFPALVRDPAALEGALQFLDAAARAHAEAGSGFVDWSQPAAAPVYGAALLYARLAHALAERAGRCDPGNAWVAGLLAPLGWLAVCAADTGGAAACLTDPDFARDPAGTQQRRWGLDQAAIARRLCRRWRLPRWLAAVAGHLALPAETAKALGADPDLFVTVQLAVRLAQDGDAAARRRGGAAADLRLPVGATPAEAAAALGLAPGETDECRLPAAPGPETENRKPKTENPLHVPLLRDLLALAAENRRLSGGAALAGAEREADALHRALEGRAAGEARRLQAQKLSALAEFAAGAGHEINNPLAVISGQAQYLLGHLPSLFDLPSADGEEADAARRRAKGEDYKKALQTIISQTRRIHHLLNDLMQFARPPRPEKRAVDVPALVREVAASLQDLAAQRQVRLVIEGRPGAAEPNGNGAPPNAHHSPLTTHHSPLMTEADPRQMTTALTCLLRNAIEAAPADGWAGVRLEVPAAGRLELVVEDNGGGPSPAHREHLFDPFYSGRSAGRGRGLGLATAWRLAREHGGDVRFDPLPGGPTRFVLSLPLAADGAARPCAEPANGTAP
jgi:signal transduction histidine kinase